MNVLTRMDDVDAATDTLQMPFRFYPCLAAGLAYYLSIKKSPEKTAMLKTIYDEEFQRALAFGPQQIGLLGGAIAPTTAGQTTQRETGTGDILGTAAQLAALYFGMG